MLSSHFEAALGGLDNYLAVSVRLLWCLAFFMRYICCVQMGDLEVRWSFGPLEYPLLFDLGGRTAPRA